MNPTFGGARAWLLAVWIAALLLLGWFVHSRLDIATDLRLFLPSPQTAQERLVLEEIGEGPGSRMLVLALSGGAPAELADASRALAAQLDGHPSFRFVANGELSIDQVPQPLLPYRYLLSGTLDEHTFDRDFLRGALQARARDLASPAGAFLEPWLPHDPTLELLAVLQRWQPAQEPNRLYDVWFDRAGERALLLAETAAPAFDPDRQRTAIQALHAAFAPIAAEQGLTMIVSGTGQFSVLMEERTRGEAQRFGTATTIGIVVLLLIAYRSLSSIAFSALPLATAGLTALAVVSALYGQVHGITLAFGFTLIGVAQDYPIHLLSHRREHLPALTVVRRLWPTLATGVASTCIAYLTFLFSDVVGLQQLAWFTIAGLAAASLSTRFLLPRLMGPVDRDYGTSQRLQRLWAWVDALPRPRWMPLILILMSLAAIGLSRTPLWEDDLGKLTPVPRELIEQDQALRSALSAADMRYLLVVGAPSAQHALERLEQLQRSLENLVQEGAIAGFDHAARYIPSIARQRARQQQLPDEPALRAALAAAQEGTGFRENVFEPFLQDVQQAKALAPLTPEDLSESHLGAGLDMLLTQSGTQTRAFVTLTDVRDPQALADLAAAHDEVLLLDLKSASETLVSRQRTHILWSLAGAAVLLVVVVVFALRHRMRVYRVLAPMAVTTLIVIAILLLAGISLSLFHLIALMLAAGLGLDYALFFEHAADDPLEQRRTLHAVLVCSLSTLLVFALLATSDIPVLRAIGLTVTLGVVANFVLALMLSRATGSRPLATVQRGLEHAVYPPARTSPGGSAPLRIASGQQPVATTAGMQEVEQRREQLPSGQWPGVANLVPHAGAMCLLDRIVEWDDAGIRLATSTHRAADHPLRRDGRLRSIHLCEYGAQAMAVHGALKSQAHGEGAQPGMLVSLRSVTFSRDYLEDLKGELIVEAVCLQTNSASLQYSFRITHEDQVLAEGRAAVVLGEA